MQTINIAQDFSKTPGARNYSDGPFSGQEFYEVLLRKKFTDALHSGQKLKVILDGTEGYASSFLNEAFSLLGNEFNPKDVWGNIIIVSNEVPKYITRIKDSIFEKRSSKKSNEQFA